MRENGNHSTLEPESFTLDYPGWWDEISRCRITIYRPHRNTIVAIATELPDNPGVHVRQVSANLATTLLYRLDVSPETLMWIEYDPCELTPSARLQRVVLRWDSHRFYEFQRFAVSPAQLHSWTSGQWR